MVFTDGACAGNPGPGGWAWAVAPEGAPFGSGGAAHSTNQRMELQAVLEALQKWAADDLRSLNAQIEYVLRDALVRAGRTPGKKGPPYR